jgi:DNA-binding CsgD family transcriptional regulator
MEQGTFPETIYHSINFSNQFFKQYINCRYYEKSAVCNSALTTWQPQHWQTAWRRDRKGRGRSAMQLALDYGYLDGWICANYHHVNNCMSAFVFAGRKAEKDERTAAILKYLTPHIAEAIKGIFKHDLKRHRAVKRMKLTSRELEVLKWIEQGKSTWDVSMILNRSERVVKWHVNNVMKKLSALNRTHAVAIALRHGLID